MPSEAPLSILPAGASVLSHLGQQAQARRHLHKLSRKALAQLCQCSPSVLDDFEHGKRLPSPAALETLVERLGLDDQPVWQTLLRAREHYLIALAFQELLSEMVGKPVTFEALDLTSRLSAVEAIRLFLSRGHGLDMTLHQACAHFNTLLTFYGERPVTVAFYRYFLGNGNFATVAEFATRIRTFQTQAIRIYGSFRRAFKTLSKSEDLSIELAALAPISPAEFTQRLPFRSIHAIPQERLDDLGYISAERVKLQNRERQRMASALREVADWLEANPSQGLQVYARHSGRSFQRLQAELRMYSNLELEETLFGSPDPSDIRREAEHIAPRDEALARIEETQEWGMQNLAAYLTEPYMDVYIATSMRERADFISVNAFVETLFAHERIAPLHLRYFNPTLSWVADRVAKGLVEALMLRRARLTIYMAQKQDTFGKDSEASVALGQGKPVIVYVPRLFDAEQGIHSESLYQRSEAELRQRLAELGDVPEEELDHQGLVKRLLQRQLQALPGADLARLVDRHWADFDLYGSLRDLHLEDREQERTLRKEVGDYLDWLTLRAPNSALMEPSPRVATALIDLLVEGAIFFERRAKTFKEVHPLALQVILSSGVLNGILVVRSVEVCAQVMYELLTHSLQTELQVDADNYRLLEKRTRSTLRVISRHQLLTNAFWTQFFG
jgi:transcriptional regulator with XRE-family HTH domain